MYKKNKLFTILFSSTYIIIFFLLLINLVFARGRGFLSEFFLSTYGWMGLVVIVVGLGVFILDLIELFRERESPISRGFFWVESSPYKPLSFSLWAQIGSFVILALLVAFVALGSNQSIVPINNPYSVGEITSETLATQSAATNLFYISVYPAFFEEAATFLFISSIVVLIGLIISLMFRDWSLRHNPFVHWFSVIVAVTIGAIRFASAHGLSYGQNLQAYIFAFIYIWIVQFFNQLTGFFGSWLPHLVNNALVSLNLTTAFSIGGVALLMFIIPKKIFNKGDNK